MAIKFEKIHADMMLYDVRRNTGFGGSKWNTWPVHIKSVDSEARTVIASWNCNEYKTMSERTVCKLRAKKPL